MRCNSATGFGGLPRGISYLIHHLFLTHYLHHSERLGLCMCVLHLRPTPCLTFPPPCIAVSNDGDECCKTYERRVTANQDYGVAHGLLEMGRNLSLVHRISNMRQRYLSLSSLELRSHRRNEVDDDSVGYLFASAVQVCSRCSVMQALARGDHSRGMVA